PAVGIAAVVKRIDPEENVVGIENLGPRERKGEEDSVTRRDVGARNAFPHRLEGPMLGHSNVTRKRGSAEAPQVDWNNHVLLKTERITDGPGLLDLYPVPLTIVECESVETESFVACNGSSCR